MIYNTSYMKSLYLACFGTTIGLIKYRKHVNMFIIKSMVKHSIHIIYYKVFKLVIDWIEVHYSTVESHFF